MEENNNRYKPVITDFNVDWAKIKDACMATIGKRADKEPADTWKKKLLLAQHSPLRRGTISVYWEQIPYFVMGHLVRHHVGCTPFVSTSRSDRTGVDRTERRQTDFVSMEMDFNIQSLIDISRKRLCNCADAETIKYWKGLIEAVAEYDPIIAWACVPEGIHRGGCPECFSDCKVCNSILGQMEHPEDMVARYEKYNNMPVRARVLKKEKSD